MPAVQCRFPKTAAQISNLKFQISNFLIPSSPRFVPHRFGSSSNPTRPRPHVQSPRQAFLHRRDVGLQHGASRRQCLFPMALLRCGTGFPAGQIRTLPARRDQEADQMNHGDTARRMAKHFFASSAPLRERHSSRRRKRRRGENWVG